MTSSPPAGPGPTLHTLSASPRVQRWIGAMAEELDEPLLLVDVQARLLNANAAGERALARATLLQRCDGRVLPVRSADEASFLAALAAAARSGRRRRWRGPALQVTPVLRDCAEAGELPLLVLMLRPDAPMP